MAGAGPPECMHLSRLGVAAAGGTVAEAGEGWSDFHALCCDRALNSFSKLERSEGQSGLPAHILQPPHPHPGELDISFHAFLEVEVALTATIILPPLG